MTTGDVLLKKLGRFSPDPKELPRQLQDSEERAAQALRNAEARIAELETKVAALEQHNIDNP